MIFNESGIILNENIFNGSNSYQIWNILSEEVPANFDKIIIFGNIVDNKSTIECYYKYENKKVYLYKINVINKISILLRERRNEDAKFNGDGSAWQYCMISINKNRIFRSKYDYNDDNISFDEFKNKCME